MFNVIIDVSMSEIELAELMYMVDLYDELLLDEDDYDRFIDLGNKYTGCKYENKGVMCVKRMYYEIKKRK